MLTEIASKGLDAALPARDCRGEYGIERTRWRDDAYSYPPARQRFSVHLHHAHLPFPSARASTSQPPLYACRGARVAAGRGLWSRPRFDDSFRVRPPLRESPSTDFVHLSLSQVFKGHAPANPFDRQGQVDLTANVDFVYLDKALKGTVLVITCRVSDEGTVFSLRS
jgi:hypothetical protein